MNLVALFRVDFVGEKKQDRYSVKISNCGSHKGKVDLGRLLVLMTDDVQSQLLWATLDLRNGNGNVESNRAAQSRYGVLFVLCRHTELGRWGTPNFYIAGGV